jgi:hypothetical protein
LLASRQIPEFTTFIFIFTMVLHVGDHACIFRGKYNGHFGAITGSTLLSWRLALDPRLRRRWANPTSNATVTLRKTSIREPTPDEVRANERIIAPNEPPQRAPPNDDEAEDDEEEIQLLARLVALRLSDDRRYSVFFEEMSRYRGE